MSEYIKKSSIVGLAHKLAFGRILTEREVEVIETVVNSVSDDAQVDLVRCGECRYYGKQKESQKAVYCVRSAYVSMPPDGFCSYGERKGGADGEND